MRRRLLAISWQISLLLSIVVQISLALRCSCLFRAFAMMMGGLCLSSCSCDSMVGWRGQPLRLAYVHVPPMNSNNCSFMQICMVITTQATQLLPGMPYLPAQLLHWIRATCQSASGAFSLAYIPRRMASHARCYKLPTHRARHPASTCHMSTTAAALGGLLLHPSQSRELFLY